MRGMAAIKIWQDASGKFDGLFSRHSAKVPAFVENIKWVEDDGVPTADASRIPPVGAVLVKRVRSILGTPRC